MEARFAALLDACGLAWEYEPHAFILERDELGRPVEPFVPDFYLPELDMYVECTVMKPAHATRKRRNVRRVIERYGVLVTLQERDDLERLVREHRPSAPEAAG